MLSGINVAVQGMTVQMQKQDQIANNLANINTTGFKRSQLFVNSIEKYMKNDKQQVSGERTIKADEQFTDFREGPLKQTDNRMDLALRGTGFFTVMTPNGVRYTRDGSFTLDAEGYLATTQGDRVFGDDGFIKIDTEGNELAVLEDGSVIQNGQEIDKIRISDFKKPYKVLHMGGNYYRPEMPNTPARASGGFLIKQGFLEGSNVDGIQEMTDMISSNRIYEAVANAMKSQDETLGKAVNSVGRVQ